MPAKKPKAKPSIPPEKELPAPDEKLLRAPTFSEKYPFIKKYGILIIILLIIIISVLHYKLKNKSYPPDNNINYSMPFVSPTSYPSLSPNNSSENWPTYTSELGKFEIKYPPDYILNANNDASGTNAIVLEPMSYNINTYFKMQIAYKKILSGQTLNQLIKENPVCQSNTPKNTIPGSINGEGANIPAQFYFDANCDQNLKTVVYSINNNMFYIITLESQATFGDIKPSVDKIISTLKFTDQPAALSCTPRPPCLDRMPRCMIPETADMCPAPTSTLHACPMDARQCPDGSWVGRNGPSCQFTCPNNSTSIDTITPADAPILPDSQGTQGSTNGYQGSGNGYTMP